jgi:hypothetical protein
VSNSIDQLKIQTSVCILPPLFGLHQTLQCCNDFLVQLYNLWLCCHQLWVTWWSNFETCLHIQANTLTLTLIFKFRSKPCRASTAIQAVNLGIRRSVHIQLSYATSLSQPLIVCKITCRSSSAAASAVASAIWEWKKLFNWFRPDHF